MVKIEINKNFVQGDDVLQDDKGHVVLITPPLDKDYWLLRAKVYKDQYINAFPKFRTIGIGFSIEEEDWNTNLPFKVDAEIIAKHIERNKKYKKITHKKIVETIEALQEEIKKLIKEGKI